MTDILAALRSPDYQGPRQHLRRWDELDRLHGAAASEIERLRSDACLLARALAGVTPDANTQTPEEVGAARGIIEATVACYVGPVQMQEE
jgi:hypothetical protein